MKIINSVPVNFTLSSAMILAANASFLIASHNIPDGRLLVLLPVTSALILFWMLCFGIINKRLFHNNAPRFLTVYMTIISLLFVFFARDIQYIFQDVHFVPISILKSTPYLGIFPFSVYIIVLGISIAIYPLTVIALRNSGIRILTVQKETVY